MKTLFGGLAFLLAGTLHAQPSRMDTNGDGKISREEFPGSKELFDQFDRDKNDFLSPAEREAMREHRRRGGNFRRPGQGSGGNPAEDLFRAADANRDQALSSQEWQAYFAKLLAEADADKNGRLSAEEWQAWRRKNAEVRQRPDRGPKVGTAAPEVSAQFMTQQGMLDFSKIKRHTVVVFGSYT